MNDGLKPYKSLLSEFKSKQHSRINQLCRFHILRNSNQLGLAQNITLFRCWPKPLHPFH